MSRGKSSPVAVAAPEAVAVIVSWTPRSVRSADKATLAAVMPEVRDLVAATAPQTPLAARRLLWALAPMAIAMHRRFGVFGAATVNYDNVEIWVSQINATRSEGWRYGVRAALKKVGVAVNPLGWPRPPKVVSRPPAVGGYPPLEELSIHRRRHAAGILEPRGTSLGCGRRAWCRDERPRTHRRGDRRPARARRRPARSASAGPQRAAGCPSAAVAPILCARP